MDSTKYVGLDVHKDFVEEIIQMRNQFGGFDFEKVEESTDVRFVALARADGQAHRFALPPGKLSRLGPDADGCGLLYVVEATRLGSVVHERDIRGRTDFRDVPTVTIDGEHARDFDDAITIEKLANGNFWLGVHIADVSHYVQEESALDREAYERGTSVYFPERAVHMFPSELATGPSCDREPTLYSLDDTVPTTIQFINETLRAQNIYWLDFSGSRVLYATLTPGQGFRQSTFVTHPWVIGDVGQVCETIFLPTADATRATLPHENWTYEATMPTRRSGLAAVAAQGQIFAMGGFNNLGYQNVVEALDPVTDTWDPSRAAMFAWRGTRTTWCCGAS